MSSLVCQGPSRKRKERDGSDAHRAEPKAAAAKADAEPARAPVGNRLLAGYLAHEFLTHGTLFGQRWGPTRAADQPGNRVQGRPEQGPAPAAKPPPPPPRGYAEVARLLKTDGAHIPGIVNPAQLAQWLRM